MEIITSHNGMKAILELDDGEIKWWRDKIGDVRSRYVPNAKGLIADHVAGLSKQPDFFDQVKNTSSFIRSVRDHTWNTYIESELQFYRAVVKELLEERPSPHSVLATVVSDEVCAGLQGASSQAELLAAISDLFGNFAGRIFPYFFELSKSVTNSRRSRAGKAFEEIVHSIMHAYGYSYDDQSSLGKKTFEQKGLGKMVDGILPGTDAYAVSRQKCLVLTMKTSLRERWQEVVEELHRTNIPSIHLLTLDEGINVNLLDLMKNHNITLVTYAEIKDKFPDHTNIISFETLFNVEIPHMMDWWIRNYPDQCRKSP